MIRSYVESLAKRLQEKQEYVNGLGIMNTPTDFKERVDAMAKLRMAHDEPDRAKKEYEEAFDQWYKAGRPE